MTTLLILAGAVLLWLLLRMVAAEMRAEQPPRPAEDTGETAGFTYHDGQVVAVFQGHRLSSDEGMAAALSWDWGVPDAE